MICKRKKILNKGAGVFKSKFTSVCKIEHGTYELKICSRAMEDLPEKYLSTKWSIKKIYRFWKFRKKDLITYCSHEEKDLNKIP